MAILPLQKRMVYRIGQRHRYSLDRGHIRDFLATAGVGLAARAVENVARRFIGGLAGQLFGGLGRGIVGTGTGAAFAFAGTYTIGRLANCYYAGGRKMDTAVLRDTYARLLAEGRALFGQYAGAVQSRASTLNPSDVINLVRNPQRLLDPARGFSTPGAQRPPRTAGDSDRTVRRAAGRVRVGALR